MTELTNVVVHEHYQHRHGGIYFVEGVATHTETKERVVVYSHVFPFEEAMWVRPISMWTPDRFRKLNAAELDVVLDRMKEITEGKFDRLMWEISTMMQDDTYSSEVKEQCVDLPGYKRFVNALGQLKENIRRRYQRDVELTAQVIEERLARPHF